MARKILLADDSVTAQNMGRKILTDAGYEVMTVNNGSAALKRIAEQKPDLIVLDVYMPGYSGLEVCQRLKDSRETSRIPILLTVGKLEPFKPEDARRVAADAFIVKPFEASELLSALTRLEDQIVPQGDTSRFSSRVDGYSAGPAATIEPSDAGEQGWKNRLRFPSKKSKKEEPEPELNYVSPSAFREFRERAAEKSAKPKAAAETRSEHQETGPVPDIPRDITPDELDALSALAAKLDRPIPPAEVFSAHGSKIADINAGGSAEAVKPETPTGEGAGESTSAAAAEATTVAESKTEAIAAEPVTQTAATEAPDKAPAEIDREDEPFFATAAAVRLPEAAEPESQEPPAAMTDSSTSERLSSPVQENQTAAAHEPGAKDQTKAEEMVAEAVAEKAIAEQAAGEGRVPTDEELAEALRLLTPVHDAASDQCQGSASNGQAGAPASSVDQKAAAGHDGNGTRWHAIPVELSSEEMSVSLEAEMFRAVVPEPAAAIVPNAAVEASRPQNEMAVAADQLAEVSTASQMEPPPAIAASAPVIEEAGNEAGSEEKRTAMCETVAGPTPEEAGPVTFAAHETADSGGQRPMESSGEQMPEHASVTHASLEQSEEATGDQQSMSKHAKTNHGKGSKSGWHQIHTATTTAKTDVETANPSEGEPKTEESPKAMAAAAAGDDASRAAAAPDPNAIANIVDSVLADLRPRIVEEIAKKLANK